MKRRDFLSKSTLGAAVAGTVLTTLPTDAHPVAQPSSLPFPEKTDTVAQDNGPVTETLQYADKPRSGVMIGGIGAGGAEIRKDGVFYNWSIMNNSPKGTGPFYSRNVILDSNAYTQSLYPYEDSNTLFFLVRYQIEGEEPRIKLLQIDEGFQVAAVPMHLYEMPWLTGVEKIDYQARFPYATLRYTDSEMPFEAELTTWAPFIPHDVKNSSLPIMYFDFKLKAKPGKKVDLMLIASHRNLVGYDTKDKYWTSSVATLSNGLCTLSGCNGMSEKASSYGTMGLASLSADSTYYMGWEHRHPYYEMLLRNPKFANTDDTENRNGTDKNGKKIGNYRCWNSIAVSKKLSAGDVLEHSFALGWIFPNNYDEKQQVNVGHYYLNFFPTCKDVLEYAVANKKDLQARTMGFVKNFYQSTAPQFVLDQVNSQLNTFVTSGVLGKKMEFGVLEGLTHHQNWGPVGTTDVNMYGGMMVTALFPDLQKSTMRVHKALQHKGGEIQHSFQKGFADAMLLAVNAQGFIVSERLDLPAQYTVMVLRDFFWTNDKAYLTEFWPSVKKALDYVVNERDKNGDQQPDMTGIMSSYDNFPMYGMATYIQSQWLCALAGAVEAAKVMGDSAAQKKYTAIFEKGKKLAEEKLWNGKYYRLYNSDLKTYTVKDGAGKEVTKDISGTDEGCLTDQLIGQWAARVAGLGDLYQKDRIKMALSNILSMSYKPKYGLRNCSWPGDAMWHEIPKDIWVDQANTCWSGVELSFASFLIYEGLLNEAYQVIKTVDDRYRKAGRYFDHQEFGGHYFRSMGAWGIVNALVGLSIHQGKYTFAPQVKENDYTLFFAFPTGTAHLIKKGNSLSLQILSGKWEATSISVTQAGLSPQLSARANGAVLAKARAEANTYVLNFGKTTLLKAGEKLEIL